MGVAGLRAALARGEPLVEVAIDFRSSVDAVVATDWINARYDDTDLCPRPWYDRPLARVGSATRGALERLFGLRLRRVPLPQFDEATGAWVVAPNPCRTRPVPPGGAKGPQLGRVELAAAEPLAAADRGEVS